MKGVDVSTFDFNFDLTFAVLLMHADGTIHHTFAGRDHTDAQSHQSMRSLVDVLEKTSVEHAAYARAPKPPTAKKPQTVEGSPWMKKRPKQPECYHCHMVNDGRFGERQERGQFETSDVFTWPDPAQVGLTLDRDVQTRVTAVAEGSAAAQAGLLTGDRLRTLDGHRVLTFGDIQRVLDAQPSAGATLPVTWLRGDEEGSGRLKLARGWRVPSPLLFAWRSSKWVLSPRPGFGGPALSAEQKRALGLPEAPFAFRVNYIVTWGDHAYTGRNAQKAGLRKGDIVLSMAGTNDFQSIDHVHAWYRLTQKVGTTIPVEILRGDERKTLQLPVIE